MSGAKSTVSWNRWPGRLWRAGVGAVLVLQLSCAPSGPVIKVESPASSLGANDPARASVTVENIADLTAFEVHLSFDAEALQVLELNNGGFIKADFILQNTFDNVAGTIDYAVAQIGRPPANGSGPLLEIVFHAKAPGESPILFRGTPAAPEGVLLSDSAGTAIPVSLIEGVIEVKE